jgi:hypothetical protein
MRISSALLKKIGKEKKAQEEMTGYLFLLTS